ncbi:MAG: hypothetical protein U0002_01725 [Thermoanaerobaculia bacterium]
MAVLAGLLMLAYANVVFRGRSLVYTNSRNPMDERGIATSYGAGFVPHRKWTSAGLSLFANFHDPGGAWWQWEPGAEAFRRGLAEGELPWWDPYDGAGTPAMANLMPAPLFPPYLLMLLLGNTVLLRNVYALLTLLGAAWFTYRLLRDHGVGFRGAVFGGAAFAFSGALAQNVGSFIGQTTATLPFALWLTGRFFERPSPGRAAVLAAGYAAVSMASFPPVLVAVFGLAAAYALVMSKPAEAAGSWARRWLAWAGAAALGLALVGFYYLPFASLVRTATHVGEAYSRSGMEKLPLATLLQLASPTLAGGGKVYTDPPVPDPDPLLRELPYLGLVPLLLAGLARGGEGRRRQFYSLVAASAAVVLLKILGVEPIASLGRLPVLQSIHFASYFGLPLAFLLALLAGLGWDTLERGEVPPRRARFVALGGGVWLATLLVYGWSLGAPRHPLAERWWLGWGALASLCVAAGALLLRSHLRQGWARTRLPAMLGLLFVAEAVANTAYPRPKRFDVWRHPPPYVEVLQKEAGLGRVFNASSFEANAGSVFQVMSLDSLSTFNSTRVTRFYGLYANRRSYYFLREAVRLPREEALDRADIELLSIREDRHEIVTEAEARGYATVYQDGFVRIFRRSGNPRYFFTSEYAKTDGLTALRLVGRNKPTRELLLEEELGFASTPNLPEDPPVRVAEFHRNGYRLELEAPRRGLVYCSESSMPGWTVRVNGQPARFLAANFAFRAIEVPAGRVVIETSYWPPGLSAGLGVSMLGLLVLGALVLRSRSRGRPSLGPASPHPEG